MNPFIDDPQARYQDRLNEAEQWRLAKPARVTHVSRFDRLRVRIGARLIALGQYLTVVDQPAQQFD